MHFSLQMVHTYSYLLAIFFQSRLRKYKFKYETERVTFAFIELAELFV